MKGATEAFFTKAVYYEKRALRALSGTLLLHLLVSLSASCHHAWGRIVGLTGFSLPPICPISLCLLSVPFLSLLSSALNFTLSPFVSSFHSFSSSSLHFTLCLSFVSLFPTFPSSSLYSRRWEMIHRFICVKSILLTSLRRRRRGKGRIQVSTTLEI